MVLRDRSIILASICTVTVCAVTKCSLIPAFLTVTVHTEDSSFRGSSNFSNPIRLARARSYAATIIASSSSPSIRSFRSSSERSAISKTLALLF